MSARVTTQAEDRQPALGRIVGHFEDRTVTKLPVLAWHFVGDTLRDGRPVPPDGEWLVHEGPVALCESGLHASRHPFDALRYAPGAILCRVECEDVVAEDHDKLVCRRRRIVARVDMSSALRAFARGEASRVLHLWDAPEVVRQYLATGDETMRGAAMEAAMEAAWAAAWAAAREAARAAARAAAWAAARAAAMEAARAAARAAAWAAAREAAMEAAMEAARAAAWAAARAAAMEAAMEASRDRFGALVGAAFAEVGR